jgi:hypothetical protein
MSELFLGGVLSIAIGLAGIAFLRPGLRQTQQWLDRWPHPGWRPPLWLHGAGWTVTALGFIALGIWSIVEAVTR